MQKLYSSNELAKAAGCAKATISLWADKGWVKPCRMSGDNSRSHDRVFTQSEYDRIMVAVREAEGRPRRIYVFLNRTLHEARDYDVLTCAELAARCGCCETTVRKVLVRLGYPKYRNVAVLEEDVAEVQAMVRKFREEGLQKRSAARKTAVAKPEATGSITVHLKGIAIELSREDANALAEELISQL